MYVYVYIALGILLFWLEHDLIVKSLIIKDLIDKDLIVKDFIVKHLIDKGMMIC